MRTHAWIKKIMELLRQGKREYFPGFDLPASRLSSFLYGSGIFFISMKGKGGAARVRHQPDDADGFRSWLLDHGVIDFTEETVSKEKK